MFCIFTIMLKGIMRKYYLVFVLLFFFTNNVWATHIAGGELFYEHLGPGSAANTDRYRVTMRLFRVCGPSTPNNAPLDGENVTIGIYEMPGLTLINSIRLTQQFVGSPPQIKNSSGANPCLVPFVSVCYEVGVFSSEIELPRTPNGFTLSWIRYTRTFLNNISGTDIGATFVTRIPGSAQLPNGVNSCPKFGVRDTTTICLNTPFTLDFGATDPDGDSLSYKLTAAYNGFGGSANNPNPIPPPSPLQLVPLNYIPPYSGINPFGTTTTINPNTGLITAIAPNTTGRFVVCVIAEEWRNGILINEHRKDVILAVENCSTVKPELTPDDKTCNGLTFSFENISPNSAITNYLWTFGDGNTSTQPTPTHTYTDTGKYTVKLKVTANGGCIDSASKTVYAFPVFNPSINVDGSCVQQPIRFFDATTTTFGVVNGWKWNFGDPTTQADTSYKKDTVWKYSAPGTYTVTLTSSNSKGCEDTVTKVIVVRDQPIINLPFRDTLICSIDTLPLIVNASGTYTWTPNINIINPTSANPLVYPKDTITYTITVNDDGCVNKDSIKVNVLDFITVDAGVDSTICKTDTIRLRPTSFALSYLWTASTGETVAPVKFPLVKPLTVTKYYVTANLGKCQDKDSITITPIPYPEVTTSSVAPICFGNKIQLNANIVGSAFTWNPTNAMLNANTLTPTVAPSATTSYVISVTDDKGCPKPVKDTITVTVIPPVTVNAGRDTSVVRNQPLQLMVQHDSLPVGTTYNWTPSTWLNNSFIRNPIATINSNIQQITYNVKVTRPEGCFGEDAITVRVFSTNPDIFIPTAFTPNNDGKNDVFKPIPVGITQLEFFRVYNRWGQLLYETKEMGKGWDGNVNGKPQPSGTFVFFAQGVDYTGKTITKKGTFVLIR